MAAVRAKKRVWQAIGGHTWAVAVPAAVVGVRGVCLCFVLRGGGGGAFGGRKLPTLDVPPNGSSDDACLLALPTHAVARHRLGPNPHRKLS